MTLSILAYNYRYLPAHTMSILYSLIFISSSNLDTGVLRQPYHPTYLSPFSCQSSSQRNGSAPPSIREPSSTPTSLPSNPLISINPMLRTVVSHHNRYSSSYSAFGHSTHCSAGAPSTTLYRRGSLLLYSQPPDALGYLA